MPAVTLHSITASVGNGGKNNKSDVLLPEIGKEFLTLMMNGAPLERVRVGAKDGEFVFEF